MKLHSDRFKKIARHYFIVERNQKPKNAISAKKQNGAIKIVG
jgi:hypothetical protein